MADGPAGLRIARAYGIDRNGFFHRMDSNLVEANDYRFLVNQKNISFEYNSTANIDMKK